MMRWIHHPIRLINGPTQEITDSVFAGGNRYRYHGSCSGRGCEEDSERIQASSDGNGAIDKLVLTFMVMFQ